MTDFRALCVKVLAYNEGQGSYNFSHLNDYDRDNAAFDAWQEIKAELKFALAKPEPEGPTVLQIIELSDEIEAAGLGQVDFARAVLARWGNPAPQPPADGEVAELVEWLYEQLHVCLQAPWTPGIKYFGRAAYLLQRQYPRPVPVSERLPEPEDCDEEGRCWVWWKNGVRWVLDEWTHHELREGLLSDYVSHWLPAHALPLPTTND